MIILVCSGEDWRFWWSYCFLTGWCNVLLLREFKGSFLWWCGRGEDWWQGCGLLLAEWCRRRLGRLGSVLAVRQLDVNVVVTELAGNAEAVICLTHPAVASSWEEVSHSAIQVSMHTFINYHKEIMIMSQKQDGLPDFCRSWKYFDNLPSPSV